MRRWLWWLWVPVLLAVCSHAFATARDGHQFWTGSQIKAPDTDPCTRSATTGSDLDIDIWTCAANDPNDPANQGVFVVGQFPDEGIIKGICAGGSNDGTICTASGTCTGGGTCDSPVVVTLELRAAVTTGTVDIDAYAQACRAGCAVDAVDAIAGTVANGTATVAGSANDTFILTITALQIYDAEASADCSVSLCKNRLFKLLIRQSGTVAYTILKVDMSWPPPD